MYIKIRLASEGAGIVKAGIDFVEYDPKGATQFILKIDALNLTKRNRSIEKITPFMGSIASILSIGTNLKPHLVFD